MLSCSTALAGYSIFLYCHVFMPRCFCHPPWLRQSSRSRPLPPPVQHATPTLMTPLFLPINMRVSSITPFSPLEAACSPTPRPLFSFVHRLFHCPPSSTPCNPLFEFESAPQTKTKRAVSHTALGQHPRVLDQSPASDKYQAPISLSTFSLTQPLS